MSVVDIDAPSIVAPAGSTWPAMPASVAEAVCKVMHDVTGVEKRGRNEFHRYKYATVGDLMAALQPAMAEHGLVVVQSEAGRSIVQGALLVDYEFGLSSRQGETWPARIRHTGMAGLMNAKGGVDDKAHNKCHTSARKYFLQGLFQIPALEEGDPRLHDGDADGQPDAGRADQRDQRPPKNLRETAQDQMGVPRDPPPAAAEAFPITVKGVVKQIEGKDGTSAIVRWAKSAWPYALKNCKTVQEVRDLRRDNGADLAGISEVHLEAVEAVEKAIEARLAELSGASTGK